MVHGLDAVALSRFAHLVAEPGLCDRGTVIIDLADDAARDRELTTTVDAAVHCLAACRMRVLVRGGARPRPGVGGRTW